MHVLIDWANVQPRRRCPLALPLPRVFSLALELPALLLTVRVWMRVLTFVGSCNSSLGPPCMFYDVA